MFTCLRFAPVTTFVTACFVASSFAAQPAEFDSPDRVGQIAATNKDLYQTLQSFVCTEKINRFAAKQTGKERFIDTLRTKVSFENGQEHYSDVERNNEPLSKLSAVAGAWSEGEFGSLLHETAQSLGSKPAQFADNTEIEGVPVAQFYYDVNEQDSPWDLVVAGRHYRVPFRAWVWVNRSSGKIVKVTRKSIGNITDSGHISGLEWSVTLAPVELNGTTWLLPERGYYSVEYREEGRREWNELTFSDYHRYGAEVQLHFDAMNSR